MTDGRQGTLDHIAMVQKDCNEFAEKLVARGVVHDASKLESPEAEMFEAATFQLRGLTYGSPEYDAAKAGLGEALAHHYAHNSHHPEHRQNGMHEFDMLDLIEMLLDWHCATQRHENGSLETSIKINAKRFDMPEMLVNIFENTRRRFGWK